MSWSNSARAPWYFDIYNTMSQPRSRKGSKGHSSRAAWWNEYKPMEPWSLTAWWDQYQQWENALLEVQSWNLQGLCRWQGQLNQYITRLFGPSVWKRIMILPEIFKKRYKSMVAMSIVILFMMRPTGCLSKNRSSWSFRTTSRNAWNTRHSTLTV